MLYGLLLILVKVSLQLFIYNNVFIMDGIFYEKSSSKTHFCGKCFIQISTRRFPSKYSTVEIVSKSFNLDAAYIFFKFGV